MKLLRFGPRGSERPGILDDNGDIRDLSGIVPDIAGTIIGRESLDQLRHVQIGHLPKVPSDVRLGSCVGAIGKYIGIGLNYADHAREVNKEVPSSPTMFLKANSAIGGAFDDIVMPRGSRKTDWEVELGVVIGAPAHYVDETEAMECVAGYCTLNDVSERRLQFMIPPETTKGKSCDTFGPVGPYLVTADEVPDPHSLRLFCEVDERRYQDSNTENLIFRIPYLISYLSGFFTLEPGDIIATGTPAGIGSAQQPPIYLRSGQRVRCGVEGLGEQSHLVVASP